MKKIITGVKPTGASMHLGNLLGAVLPFDRLAHGNNAAIFIADLHALTSVKDGEKLRKQSHELAVEYLAIHGTDTPITIFRQSDIVLLPKLNWILNNVTPYSLMLRAHSFKDFEQKFKELQSELDFSKWYTTAYNEIITALKNKWWADLIGISEDRDAKYRENEKELIDLRARYETNLNMGVFNYPILMAADIIGYDIEAVPVGRDQIQHLEMARDIARAFNKTYHREVFREPQAIVDKAVETLPGVDGRKMSKSYDNFIGVFDDEKTLKKRVMSIVTDSRGVDERKDPDTCNVFALIKVFGSAERVAAIRAKYESENAGYGYGHAKLELLEILTDYLRPYRERREALLWDPTFVEKKLAEGARIMNARMEEKMAAVSEVVGL